MEGHGSGLQRFRGVMDGGADADIGGAAADVAVHGEIDVVIARLGIEAEPRRGVYPLAGLAIPALRPVERDPRLLHRDAFPALQPFDRRDFLAADGRNRHRARADRLAAEIDGASAALRDTATVFRAGETGIVADGPQQGRVGIDIDLVILSVDLEGERRHVANPPHKGARAIRDTRPWSVTDAMRNNFGAPRASPAIQAGHTPQLWRTHREPNQFFATPWIGRRR